jgi:hypothetical protein
VYYCPDWVEFRKKEAGQKKVTMIVGEILVPILKDQANINS